MEGSKNEVINFTNKKYNKNLKYFSVITKKIPKIECPLIKDILVNEDKRIIFGGKRKNIKLVNKTFLLSFKGKIKISNFMK